MTDSNDEWEREFDHPCRETCSGWTQGTIKGEQALIARLAPITDAVAELIDEVQNLVDYFYTDADMENRLRAALAKLRAAMGETP